MLSAGDMICAENRTYTVLRYLGRGANSAAFLAECSHGTLVSHCILKEFHPQDADRCEQKKQRFLAAGKMQNEIRQLSALQNQTPPVSHIFEAEGSAYIAVACYGGNTLDALSSLTLPQYAEICRTVAKTVSYYHKAGYLCLDLKPENLFIMQNAPDDTVTQLVEFIDFDSIRRKNEINTETGISYTRNWAAPEQMDPYAAARVSAAADIFTVGELLFYHLFSRHSTEHEHRGFSRYPFERCRREYRKYADRPDVQALFIRLFRGTLRSSAANRFRSMDEVIPLLDELTAALNRREYVIPRFPPVSPHFVGRNAELAQIAEELQKNRVLFLNGVGGIGKSTVIRNYIDRNKTQYDVIVYLESDGDLKRTFTDDYQLQISTVSRMNTETTNEYFIRKLSQLRRICEGKRVLLIIDNYNSPITKDLTRLIECGYETVIVTRSLPPVNSFASLEIKAISEPADLFRLIALNLERNLTKVERSGFTAIMTTVQGHTLVLELAARQIAAGRMDISTALNQIRKNGVSRFSDQEIRNYKDGEEASGTLSAIISALFDASGMTDREYLLMKVLSLLDVRGLESQLIRDILKADMTDIPKLNAAGWLYADGRIRVHPVVAETLRNADWRNTDAVQVMELSKKVIDIYVGMANSEQIAVILRESERYTERSTSHMLKALCCDMRSTYYDVLLDGAYIPYHEKEAELLQKLIRSEETAIYEMQRSSHPKRDDCIIKFSLGYAAVLIRSSPQHHAKAKALLKNVKAMLSREEYSENRCYYDMVCAWFYTLVEPDIAGTVKMTDDAERIAEQVFPTDLERVDIIHIPAANCFFYHNDLKRAAEKLQEAIALCRAHPDSVPYIDKEADLLNCLLDVYFRAGDYAECRETIRQIDRINEAYGEQGVFREVSPEIREKAGFP